MDRRDTKKILLQSLLQQRRGKADYKKAMKEHNADFQKWKKAYRQELNIEGYLRYEDYFIGLRDKTLQWRKLGKETKKFLQTFPHLRLTHYKEEFAPC